MNIEGGIRMTLMKHGEFLKKINLNKQKTGKQI